jgi:hypothetical protein
MESVFRRVRPTPSNRLERASRVILTVLRVLVVISTSVVAAHLIVRFLIMDGASQLVANRSSLTRRHPLVSLAIPVVRAAQEQGRVIVLVVPAPVPFYVLAHAPPPIA